MDIDLLSKMVYDLILENDRVALPGVGCFVAEIVPASFSDKGYTINPPYRRLSFRTRPDDGELLVGLYSKSNGIPAEDARRILVDFLSEMKEVLLSRKVIVFPGLGRLRATRENNIFFVADEALDIYPEGFGLQSLSLKTHKETAEELSTAIDEIGDMLAAAPAVASGPVAEPAPEAAPELTPAPVSETVQVSAVEPVPETVLESTSESAVEPASGPAPVNVAESVSEAVPESASASVVEPVVETVPEPVLDPASETAPESVAEAVWEPAPESASEYASEAATEPTVEPTPEPAVEPVLGPALEPASGPAPERRLSKGWKTALIALLSTAAVAALLLGTYLLLARLCPDFIDSILYTPEELEILHYPL